MSPEERPISGIALCVAFSHDLAVIVDAVRYSRGIGSIGEPRQTGELSVAPEKGPESFRGVGASNHFSLIVHIMREIMVHIRRIGLTDLIELIGCLRACPLRQREEND